jgi:hypothetical protein
MFVVVYDELLGALGKECGRVTDLEFRFVVFDPARDRERRICICRPPIDIDTSKIKTLRPRVFIDMRQADPEYVHQGCWTLIM